MSRKRMGGKLDVAGLALLGCEGDYLTRAGLHTPELRAEALRLLRTGMPAGDVACALGIAEADVARWAT